MVKPPPRYDDAVVTAWAAETRVSSGVEDQRLGAISQYSADAPVMSTDKMIPPPGPVSPTEQRAKLEQRCVEAGSHDGVVALVALADPWASVVGERRDTSLTLHERTGRTRGDSSPAL